ncbi:MAG TPA: precorrin-3B C(17)-methyltransferase [Nostocaceae cyanobacterium]|nr:precorrin-3B C(17)-methyltransferase [Nostocaceae cyanobacterium]
MKASPAIVILGQNSTTIARQIISVLPGAKLYGLASRTTEVDVSFENFGETVRGLFAAGTPIIGICAAGILIRTIAPLLTDKGQEPPVLAVAEDGSAVVPLLGGLSGVNDLARNIAEGLKVSAAITTTGDIRFRTALLSPPPGYKLANPEDAKKFIADLLAGATVKLDGKAAWLNQSKLPIQPDGDLTIKITEKSYAPAPNCLVYHPAVVAIAISGIAGKAKETIALIRQILADAQLSPAAVAGIFAPLDLSGDYAIQHVADDLGVPTRFFPAKHLSELTSRGYSLSQAIALAATRLSGKLIFPPPPYSISSPMAIAIASHLINPDKIGQTRGKLAIIGTGPGASHWMSPEVKEILHQATDLVGYKTYLDLIGNLAQGKQRHESDNREEETRAQAALDLAAQGRYVALVSSGDPGIYAMATAVFEVIDRYQKPQWQNIDIQVAPGISAMQAVAAAIGAPLGHDFCVISLSDILKPWEIIAQRIAAAAQADFVMAFYNPVSKDRLWQLAEAKNILLQYRQPDTPVILGQNLGRLGQRVKVTTLNELDPLDADMRTTIIVGSSHTRTVQLSDGNIRVYTSRRYRTE